MSAASQRRRSLGGAGAGAGAGAPPSAAGSSPAPGSAPRGGGYRRRVSVGAAGRDGGGDMTPGAGAVVVVAAERPGLRLMRVVGSQYDATVAVEAWVARAEAKIKVRGGQDRKGFASGGGGGSRVVVRGLVFG